MNYTLKIRDSFGKLLEVVQEIPSKGDKFPTVVMVPGFGMDLHEYGYFDEASDLLIKNGFQTFRFSFAGTGKSEGDFADMTLDRQARELHDILQYVEQDRFTDTTRIGLLAQSFGAITTIGALPISAVKTFLFTSAPADPYASLSRWFRGQRGFDPDGISEIEHSDKSKTRIGTQFWKNLAQQKFSEKLRLVSQPILFIYGSRDKRIKRWEIQDHYFSVIARKKLLLIDQADHGFTGKFRPTVLKLIVDWFAETLR